MRVAIDTRKIHDFGIGTYIRNLLRQLARIDRDTEYVLLCRPEDRDWFSGLGPNFRAVVERAEPYSIREQFTVPWRLLRERVQLFHSPHYVLPTLSALELTLRDLGYKCEPGVGVAAAQAAFADAV